MQPLVVSAFGQTIFSNILKYFPEKYFLIKTSVDFNLNNFYKNCIFPSVNSKSEE